MILKIKGYFLWQKRKKAFKTMEFHYSDRMNGLSGNAIREIFKLLAQPDVVSFAGGMPASVCLPAEDVKRLAVECLERNPVGLLQYGSTEGYLPLRQTLTSFVNRVGIENQTIDNVLVISGGQQGIDLACKTMLNKGDKVLVQKPTYLAVLHILKTYEAKPIGVETNDEGLDLEDLEKKIVSENPKFVYLVPNFSNPTGKTLSVQSRKKVAELSKKYGVLIVEDDPYRELRYSGEHLPSIKSFDTHGGVLYLSSISKVIAPALRVGYAVGAEELIRKMTICKQAVDVHTNTLAQAVVNEYITRDMLFPALEKAIPVYRKKRDVMIAALEREMPASFRFTRPDGGLFIWGEFTDGTSAVAKFKAAVENKVAFVSGTDFYADGSGENTLRLNFSNATEEQIEIGVKRLAEVFQK